ncbi:MAG: HAMP domain-containing histidine kinase [Proteobacteria bacterium]|nr:HAMP domain-containing histidine kinase [Pseudomonadota bacterium]MBU6425921.1 HAMP domain-containing histidine kinase [Rhodospirillales bacterium]
MSWLARFKPQPVSLSSKLLWCTVLSILIIEILATIPVLGQQRLYWMQELKGRADIAALALQSPHTEEANNLLLLAGVQRLTLISTRGRTATWQVSGYKATNLHLVTPGNEPIGRGYITICRRIAGLAPSEEAVLFPSAIIPGGVMIVDADASSLTTRLRFYAQQAFSMIIIVSLLSGLLVYAVLNWLLVRPMEILTASIIHFREAPEEADICGLNLLANRPKDDISSAARELKLMQEELRAALWRNARLAAVGTAVAKIAHDLRNILSSALLVADRLQDVEDPVVKRATRMLIPSVERAAQLVSSTVEFAREGRMSVNRSPVRIRALIDEVAEMLAPDGAGLTIENLVPEDLELPLDRSHLHRVFANLIRNAAEAGATLVSLAAEPRAEHTRLTVTDNGPGLPERAKANLFKPFAGSARSGGTGLGLTIARDLIRAHGGELMLERTGPGGTIFSMVLAAHELQEITPAFTAPSLG